MTKLLFAILWGGRKWAIIKTSSRHARERLFLSRRRWFYLLCGVSFGLFKRELDANQKRSLASKETSRNYGNGPVH